MDFENPAPTADPLQDAIVATLFMRQYMARIGTCQKSGVH
jgi:hypothetical protein